MKNQVPFKCYQAAIYWLNQFNSNLLPKEKIRHWEVEYLPNNIVLLKF